MQLAHLARRALTTMLPNVTWPSPPMATCTPSGVCRRTLMMVVP
jgi:hypothetical protein